MTATLPWQTLNSGHTGRLAIRGERVAASTLDRLGLWRGGTPLAQAQSPVRAPGWPMLADQALFWGPGHWTSAAGYQPSAALLALCGHGRRVPHCWAWRDDGERVLLSLGGSGELGAQGAAQAVLAEPSGAAVIELRRDAGAGAAACCLGRQLAVVGSARASVHEAGGRLRHELDNPTPALRVTLCADDQRLLLVESGRLSLYRTDNGGLLTRSEGAWIDAAPAPDASRIVAVDVQGRLALLDPHDLSAPPTWLATDDPVQAVAADEDQIVAAFVRHAPLRVTTWTAAARPP